MEDIMNKINKILSDPESIKQISELAQMFMSETGNNNKSSNASDSNPDNSENSSDSDSGAFSGLDFSKLIKIQEIIGAVSGKDKNAELLLALKPHLSPERQKKADKAIKLLKLLTVWNIIKDSGMLKDFLN
ncbi:MAG: hypothetical protein PUA51_06670 [Oscillospiraceae bacterium]|nr:hypothetical protein [Oscillospiraceae bacterium]